MSEISVSNVKKLADTAQQIVMRESGRLEFNSDGFSDLSALFTAIKNGAHDPAVVERLANVGKYLCDDWSNLFDVESENTENDVRALRAVAKEFEATNPSRANR